MLRTVKSWLFDYPTMWAVVLSVIMSGIARAVDDPPLFANSPNAFVWFTRHGPETSQGWAVVFTALAIAGWLAVAAYWLPRRFLHVRAWVQLIGSGLLGCGHAVFAYGIYCSNPYATGWRTYAVLALCSLWLITLIGIHEDPNKGERNGRAAPHPVQPGT